MTKPSTENLNSSLWPRTIWPEVRDAAEAVGKETRPLEELYRRYQIPLRVHLHCTFREFPLVLKNSEDLLQAFALKKILAAGWLARADPRKGRFRDFLRTSLSNFVWDWLKKQQPDVDL